MFHRIKIFDKKNKYGLRDNASILVDNVRLDAAPFADPLFVSRLFKRMVNKRLDKFRPDKSRVITRYLEMRSSENVRGIVAGIMALREEEVVALLGGILKDFQARHKDLKHIFMRHFGEVNKHLEQEQALSLERKLLIGAYFTMEYSVESTALFNPSVVIYPKQNDLKKGQTRVVFSFRATGEGHISSIVFRSAIIDAQNEIYMEPISHYVATPQTIMNPMYDKPCFEMKLRELHVYNEISEKIMAALKERFTYSELKKEVENIKQQKIESASDLGKTVEDIEWLADSNYEVFFPPDQLISERVIFPVSQVESNGIEDARFVRFVDDDGTVTYYATYTAYSGKEILPQLIETKDFHTFKMSTLNGPVVMNKGMALFPRKINGKYAMISRLDDRNMYLMYSDNINFWHEAVKIQEPQEPWEFVKIGNCGSPLETEHGWILLTHGVGPMRKYCIGVELLDLNDPSKIIGRLKEPLISPKESDREGYVPNVVYSCGGIILNRELIIPYALSDSVSDIAVISLDELLEKLAPPGKDTILDSLFRIPRSWLGEP